jgi:hypothetical protein
VLTVRHDLISAQAYAPGIQASVRHAAQARGVLRGIEQAFEV